MNFSYFNKQKALIWLLIILTVLNISFTIGLFLNRPEDLRDNRSMRRIRKKEPDKISFFVKKELKLSKEQTVRFKFLQHKHFMEIEELQNIKQKYKDETLQQLTQIHTDEHVLDSLNILIMKAQYKLEEKTTKHFLELKKLLEPEQLPYFETFLMRLTQFHYRKTDRIPRRIKKRPSSK